MIGDGNGKRVLGGGGGGGVVALERKEVENAVFYGKVVDCL